MRMSREEAEAIASKLNYRHRDGTVVAVVQDARNGLVLMVGFMNHDAVVLTLTTGYVHFWSLSRRRIWMKGETSGHRLRVQSVYVDCDLDAILVKVVPEGPVCHTGHLTCFYRRIVDGDVWDYELGLKRSLERD